jgi:carbon storage regulator|tara:strand:+ start:3591 stop:3758 length:168 start_codon:yes stop_codon:yes gene_type:complete
LLVLSRRRDQTLVIGDNVEVTVLEIKGGQVRLGINAPKAVSVHRGEIHAKVTEES